MRLIVGGTVRRGRAIDARDLDASAAAVAGAIHAGSEDPAERRGEHTDAAGDNSGHAAAVDSTRDSTGDSADDRVRVACAPPATVHERVGLVQPRMRIDSRAALADAARSRGHQSPKQAALTAARGRLTEATASTIDPAAARRAVAEAGSDEARLREEVATLRGRVETLREAGEAAEDALAELQRTARQLSEAETERIAAEQRLASAERAARDARSARERRLRLEDRVANLERQVRADLAGSVEAAFEAALRAVPAANGPRDDATDSGDRDGPVATALAVARVAAVEAPVVLAVDRFADATAAADWLDAPAILV